MRRESPRIFIDTNVWFSYFYGSVNCHKLIHAHLEGEIKAVISQQVLEEIIRNLKLKLPGGISLFRDFVSLSPPILLRDPKAISPKVTSAVHPSDQWILQAAVAAKLKFFVTGNQRHFNAEELKKSLKIDILTPVQAVKKFRL